MKKILVIGTGGLAREFTSWFAASLEIVGYFSTSPSEHSQFNLPGALHQVRVTPEIAGTDLAVIAIGAPAVKAAMYLKFEQLGFKFPTIVHPSSVVAATAQLQEGVVICPHCVVSASATLQKMVYVNFGCGIGHDSVIGNFVQINPGSQLGGASTIGEFTLIGSGSTILQGVVVGPNATIGSGSVVFAKVAPGATVMGNPAKRMRAFEASPGPGNTP